MKTGQLTVVFTVNGLNQYYVALMTVCDAAYYLYYKVNQWKGGMEGEKKAKIEKRKERTEGGIKYGRKKGNTTKEKIQHKTALDDFTPT